MGLTADGDVSVASSSDVSVGGRTMRVSSAEDVDVTSGSDLRLSSGGEIEVVSGSGVVGRVVDSVEMVAGGVSLSSGSSMDVVGGDMSMSSDGSVTGYATGGLEIGASSARGVVSGDASGTIGGAGSVLVGGDVQLGSGGSGSATFGDGVSVSGGSVVVESASGLVGVGRSVEVSGSESVRVGSTGAVVELSGSGDVEYVSYVWRSSSSFDEYENRFETISGVSEVVVRSVSADGARVLSSSGGGTVVTMDLSSSSSSWERVWSSTVGHGSYSLDGLHVRFDMMDVSGMRLGASPRSSPSFDGWSTVMLHFGRSVDSGSVSVSASSVLEAVSGESVSVSSQCVSVSAGRSLEVSGGDSVRCCERGDRGGVWVVCGCVICSCVAVCRRFAGRVQRWFGVCDEQLCSA